MASTNPQKLSGNWRSGCALDLHTVSSTHIGVDENGRDVFDTTYTELGGLLNRFKYHGEGGAAREIILTAAEFLRGQKDKFDIIVPVPASTHRTVQPVTVLASGIGAELRLPVVPCVTTTRATVQLKGITDVEKRKEALAGLHAVDKNCTTGKRVLLFDDLYRSGATLAAITELLLRRGGAANVYAFTITRTRSNR